MGQGKHLLGAAEIPQAMSSQVDERRALRQMIGDQVVHGPRQQRLTPMRDRPQPGAAAQRDPEVIALVAQLRLGRVQRDPHAQIHAGRPPATVQRSLSFECRRHRIGGPRERGDDAVAFSLLHRPHAAVAGDRFLQQPVMVSHRLGHRVRRALPQTR